MTIKEMDTKIKFDLCIFLLLFVLFVLAHFCWFLCNTDNCLCVLKAKCHICSLFIYLFIFRQTC